MDTNQIVSVIVSSPSVSEELANITKQLSFMSSFMAISSVGILIVLIVIIAVLLTAYFQSRKALKGIIESATNIAKHAEEISEMVHEEAKGYKETVSKIRNGVDNVVDKATEASVSIMDILLRPIREIVSVISAILEAISRLFGTKTK